VVGRESGGRGRRRLDRCLERVISEEPGAAPFSGGSDEQVIRAKYLDWCSARIAERFLQLTPEEIWQLAETASRDDNETLRGAVVIAGEGGELPFRWMVGRVTEALAVSLRLPTLDEWRTDYREAPDRYDSELLGLWREG
jgi:hypothetical protein